MNASSSVGRSQRPTTVSLLLIVVVAVLLGVGVRLFIDLYINSFWFELDAHRPLTNWLIARGFDGIAARWSFIYHRLPEWLLAIVLGIGIGRTLGRNWWVGAVPCAVAFFVAIHVLFFFAGEENPYSTIASFGSSVVVQIMVQDAVAPCLVLLVAYLTSRLTRGEKLFEGHSCPSKSCS